MANACCNEQTTRDLALFSALVAVPALLGFNRRIWALTTACAVGKLATSMLNQRQASRQHREEPHRAPVAAPQPPHQTPAHGGLDHVEGADSGPVGGTAGVAVIR